MKKLMFLIAFVLLSVGISSQAEAAKRTLQLVDEEEFIPTVDLQQDGNFTLNFGVRLNGGESFIYDKQLNLIVTISYYDHTFAHSVEFKPVEELTSGEFQEGETKWIAFKPRIGLLGKQKDRMKYTEFLEAYGTPQLVIHLEAKTSTRKVNFTNGEEFDIKKKTFRQLFKTAPDAPIVQGEEEPAVQGIQARGFNFALPEEDGELLPADDDEEGAVQARDVALPGVSPLAARALLPGVVPTAQQPATLARTSSEGGSGGSSAPGTLARTDAGTSSSTTYTGSSLPATGEKQSLIAIAFGLLITSISLFIYGKKHFVR